MTSSNALLLLSITVMVLSINSALLTWQIHELRQKNAQQLEINQAQLKLSQKIADLVFTKGSE